MTEYRRGCDLNGMEKLWHFDQACQLYPRRTFATQPGRPPDDDLCAQCAKHSADT
jgi:hypothetical protein